MFCRPCEQAPAGQRGGWLSAHRRRERIANGSRIDANAVAARLWIGGPPPADRDLPAFGLVVLCAREVQPTPPLSGQLLRCPLPDGVLDGRDLKRAVMSAQAVARSVASGGRVLVTCARGMNRAALVAGLALGLCTRGSADDIIATIRARRANALSNDHFVDLLRKFVANGRSPRR